MDNSESITKGTKCKTLNLNNWLLKKYNCTFKYYEVNSRLKKLTSHLK